MVLPRFVPPMLAAAGDFFSSEEHLYEVKWDGIRCLVRCDGQGVCLMSRNARDITAAFPDLTTVEHQVNGMDWIMDGELIVLDSQGIPRFDLVCRRNLMTNRQRIGHAAQIHPAVLIVFDLLYLNGENLLHLPLEIRRRTLEQALSPNARVQLSPAMIGADSRFHQAVVRQGMEGTVIKDLQSAYHAGKRTEHWTKVRHVLQSDCVICGFIPKGAAAFQSLLLGQYNAVGQLVYVGHVGTGFTSRLQTRLCELLNRLKQNEPAVTISPADGKKAHWVKPVLVCAIEHLCWTGDHKLRHPVFCGLRQDKSPQECVLEP
ncbi:MAG: non-homologous end-joining DNA ligase [Limnochordia bacterium]|jgi:bifunctional non-homologous end joining protein LigD